MRKRRNLTVKFHCLMRLKKEKDSEDKKDEDKLQTGEYLWQN